jgi:hypothetical protein
LKNKLGCSLYKEKKKKKKKRDISEINPPQGQRKGEREREILTVLATKPLNGMNETAMELRSPSQTRHL